MDVTPDEEAAVRRLQDWLLKVEEGSSVEAAVWQTYGEILAPRRRTTWLADLRAVLG